MLGMLGGVGGGGGLSGSGGSASATSTARSDVGVELVGDTGAGLRGFNMDVHFPGASLDPTGRNVNLPETLNPSMLVYAGLSLVALLVVGKMLKG